MTLANRVSKLEQVHGTGIETWTQEQVDARFAELEPHLRAEVESQGLDYASMSNADLIRFLDRSIAAENNQVKS